MSRKQYKVLLKAAITLAALYGVFSGIDTEAVWETLSCSDPFWLLMALIGFNASKIASALRLNRYFDALGLNLSQAYNLRLYYIGMFYNLFLPGGISGDGYKVYLLQRRYHIGYKRLLLATVLDRVSGLAALLFLAGLLFCLSAFSTLHTLLAPIALAVLVTIMPISYWMTRRFFGEFIELFGITTLYAFVVQLLQLSSAVCLLWAIGGSGMIDYLTLFLISSVVAVLPISIGGIGVRELTFLYGFTLIGQNVEQAVTFSLLFFMITALSSLVGAGIQIGHRDA
jgi:glycosyltransferase 2 family protein